MKNKQIDIIKNDLLKSEFWRFDEETDRFELDREKTARNLHRIGYRKASEIFEEIKTVAIIGDITGRVIITASDFAELKKKYTESEGTE